MKKFKDQILEIGKVKTLVTKKELLSMGATEELIAFWVESGLLLAEARNLYLPKHISWSKYHSNVEVTMNYPQAIICLANALSFYECTTQMPRQVWIAVPNKSFTRHETDLPIRSVYMHPIAYSQGINTHIIEGKEVKIYNLAKTIVDCFEYSEYVGMEVAFEAVKESISDNYCTRNQILSYAKPRNFTGEVLEDFSYAINHPEKIQLFI